MSNLTPIDKSLPYERIEAAIAEAKQARTRRMAGETIITSSAEMRRLLEEKRVAEEKSTMFIDDPTRVQPPYRSQ